MLCVTKWLASCVFLQYPRAEGAYQTAHQPLPWPYHWHAWGDLPVTRVSRQPAAGDTSCLWEMQQGEAFKREFGEMHFSRKKACWYKRVHCVPFLSFMTQLSDPSDLPKNAFSIFLLLVDHLCVEHIDYALEIGLSGTSGSAHFNHHLYFLSVDVTYYFGFKFRLMVAFPYTCAGLAWLGIAV